MPTRAKDPPKRHFWYTNGVRMACYRNISSCLATILIKKITHFGKRSPKATRRGAKRSPNRKKDPPFLFLAKDHPFLKRSPKATTTGAKDHPTCHATKDHTTKKRKRRGWATGLQTDPGCRPQVKGPEWCHPIRGSDRRVSDRLGLAVKVASQTGLVPSLWLSNF